jgi:hypothetical protein
VVGDVDLADVIHYEMRDYQPHRISADVVLVHFFASFSDIASGHLSR